MFPAPARTQILTLFPWPDKRGLQWLSRMHSVDEASTIFQFWETNMKRTVSFVTLILAAALGQSAFAYDRDGNPPGPRGGPGTNWENRPGPAGGPGASPDRNWKARCEAHPEKCAEAKARLREKCQSDPERCRAFMQRHRDRDGNPPGPRGGPGSNWENPPGPVGGPGASPDRL